MQLSLHADYACRVLIYLAAAETERASIGEIAAAFHISQNHLVKVVHRLAKLGFIETTRGRGGGIWLARSPNTILIGEVIRKTEPGFDVAECFDAASNTCPIFGVCGLKPWLARALDGFLSVLDGVTLADITAGRKKVARRLNIDESMR